MRKRVRRIDAFLNELIPLWKAPEQKWAVLCSPIEWKSRTSPEPLRLGPTFGPRCRGGEVP